MHGLHLEHFYPMTNPMFLAWAAMGVLFSQRDDQLIHSHTKLPRIPSRLLKTMENLTFAGEGSD